jgi:very-short-patch-repair endonuclease
MTDAERKLWSLVRRSQLQVKFRRQTPFDKYILDFYCAKARVCVELDGSQHYSARGRRKDEERDNYLRDRGVLVLRFSDAEILTNPDGVLQAISDAVHGRITSSKIPQGRTKVASRQSC